MVVCTVSKEKLPDDRPARALWVAGAAGDVGRSEARYDAWAAHYDADVTEIVGWRAPLEAAAVAAHYIPKAARILDAGAGTGLVGEALAARGSRDIVAADLTRKMLDLARAKGVYREHHKVDLTKPLNFPDASFDALLSIGTSGYVTGAVLAEFARVIRPSGYIILLIGDERYQGGGFASAIGEWKEKQVLEVVDIGPEFAAVPQAQPDHRSRLHVLRVLR